MAYEYAYPRGAANWVEIAKSSLRPGRIPATEEEEYLMEVGDDIQQGRFTPEQLETLSCRMSLDKFAQQVSYFLADAEDDPED
jgi:hypothetical protein